MQLIFIHFFRKFNKYVYRPKVADGSSAAVKSVSESLKRILRLTKLNEHRC